MKNKFYSFLAVTVFTVTLFACSSKPAENTATEPAQEAVEAPVESTDSTQTASDSTAAQ
jgi:PBP1b-binding outer membrane lipoprotein LpoB